MPPVGIVNWECLKMPLEEIEPEDKTRNEALYARVDIYVAAKKLDMVPQGTNNAYYCTASSTPLNPSANG